MFKPEIMKDSIDMGVFFTKRNAQITEPVENWLRKKDASGKKCSLFKKFKMYTPQHQDDEYSNSVDGDEEDEEP